MLCCVEGIRNNSTTVVDGGVGSRRVFGGLSNSRRFYAEMCRRCSRRRDYTGVVSASWYHGLRTMCMCSTNPVVRCTRRPQPRGKPGSRASRSAEVVFLFSCSVFAVRVYTVGSMVTESTQVTTTLHPGTRHKRNNEQYSGLAAGAPERNSAERRQLSAQMNESYKVAERPDPT